MFRRNLTRLFLGVALAATPLVTTATCDPNTGAFDFFRDDDFGDDHDHDFFDDLLDGFDDWDWDFHHHDDYF